MNLSPDVAGYIWHETFIFLCKNGLKNSPLALHSTHFRQGSLYPSLDEQLPAEYHDYCKLING